MLAFFSSLMWYVLFVHPSNLSFISLLYSFVLTLTLLKISPAFFSWQLALIHRSCWLILLLYCVTLIVCLHNMTFFVVPFYLIDFDRTNPMFRGKICLIADIMVNITQYYCEWQWMILTSPKIHRCTVQVFQIVCLLIYFYVLPLSSNGYSAMCITAGLSLLGFIGISLRKYTIFGLSSMIYFRTNFVLMNNTVKRQYAAKLSWIP